MMRADGQKAQRTGRQRTGRPAGLRSGLAGLLVLAGTAMAALPGAADAADTAAQRPAPAYPRRDAAPPTGFGAIPFGTQADAVLALNNGNGNLVMPDRGPALFRYPVVLAGLHFQVTQRFDENNRAIDAEAVYTSGEDQRSCVARFNYILAGLNHRYGPPTVIPDVVQEVRDGSIVSLYAAQYDFNDRTSIRGTVETTVPEQAGGAGAAAGTNCRIVLHYYPPGWLANF